MIHLRFLLLAVLTVAAFVAMTGVTRRFLPGHLAERLAFAMAGVLGLAVAEVMLLGVFWNLYTLPVVLALEVVVVGGLAAWLRSDIAAEWREVQATARSIVARPRVPLVIAACAAAGLIWTLTLAHSYRHPFPGVDAAAYHLPIAVLVTHAQGVEKFETRSGHVNEFPKNAQFFLARSILYAPDERPLHLPQWLAGLAIVLALYGWMRNWGVGSAVAGSLAPLFLLVPVAITQTMVLWGTIDLVFHALLVLAWAMVAHLPEERGLLLRRAAFAAAAATLTLGTKGQGVMLAGSAMAVLLVVLLIRRLPVGAWIRLAGVGMACFMVFSSYQYIQNYFWWGNPFAPIRVQVGETTVFPGYYFSVHTLVGTRAAADTANNRKALTKSVLTLWCRDWVLERSRLGAWGPAFLLAIVPGMAAAVLLMLWRRKWLWAAIGILLFFLLIRTPGSWWSRFSMHFIAFGLVFSGWLIAQAVEAGWRRIALGAQAWFLTLSIVAGVEAWWVIGRANASIDGQPAPGKYRQSLDSFLPSEDWESPELRALYLWARDEMVTDAPLLYFHHDFWGIYHYYFYKHDYSIRVHGIADQESKAEFAETLRDRGAEFFVVEHGTPEAAWAPEFGEPQRTFGKFTVYRRSE